MRAMEELAAEDPMFKEELEQIVRTDANGSTDLAVETANHGQQESGQGKTKVEGQREAASATSTLTSTRTENKKSQRESQWLQTR